MFGPNENEYFADVNCNKGTEYIIPPAEWLVNFRTNGLRAKKSCYVCAERLEYKGMIQLRITEKSDQRRMFITTVDSASFLELKQDQSLHVTFTGFIENLVHMLQDCQSGKLEMHLVQLPSGGLSECENASYQLHFVEMRSFKNLVHLCLPCRIAPLNVVLFYMNSKMDSLQQRHASQEHTIQQLQQEIGMHLRSIDQLNVENTKLRENLLENTRSLNQRHGEEMQQLQESLRKSSEQRHIDNERSQKIISNLQKQMEKLAAEKATIQADKTREQKRSEALNEELADMKSQLSALKQQKDDMQAEVATLKNTDRKHEMHLSDARKQVAELQDKLKKYDKAKADIIAELEAEKKISQTKRQALEMAAEEITKANEIILRQTQELSKLKKTVNWRTEVALQQEKAIKEKDKLLALNEEELLRARNTIDSLRLEIPQQLESMRTFANTLELKYSEQIRALREKLTPVGKENFSPLSSSNSSASTSRRK